MNILNGYDGRRVQLKRELMAWNMGYQKRSRVKQELSGLFDLPLNRELEWFSDMVGKLLPPLLVLITTLTVATITTTTIISTLKKYQLTITEHSLCAEHD